MNTADTIINETLKLWWTDVPKIDGERIGCIGVTDELSPHLLEIAEKKLRAAGCPLAIGPMDGNTWRAHRVVIESDGRLPFMLEPTSPPSIARVYQNHGYEILSQYSSSVINLDATPKGIEKLSKRIEKTGTRLRSLNVENLPHELNAIYDLSVQTFTDNFLYTPISREEFQAMYQKIAPILTQNSGILAEHEGKLVGYVFGFREQMSFIVKTLAVLPERRFAGLGTLLVHRIQESAKNSGCREAIHALQREDNQSLRISQRFESTPFRRYALYAKQL